MTKNLTNYIAAVELQVMRFTRFSLTDFQKRIVCGHFASGRSVDGAVEDILAKK